MRVVYYVLFFLSPLAFASELTLHGKIYDPKNLNTPIFYYERISTGGSNEQTSIVRYTDPQGKVMVEEWNDYKNNQLVKYNYHQEQTGDSGSFSVMDGKVNYLFQTSKETKKDRDSVEDNSFGADMIPQIVVQNWDALMKGDSYKGRFYLLERLDTFGIKISKSGERDYHGTPAVDFDLNPTSIFIRLIAPNNRVTLEKAAPHKLLEISGRLPVRVPEVPNPKTRDDYHALDGVVVFD